jgi:hypothetical protein
MEGLEGLEEVLVDFLIRHLTIHCYGLGYPRPEMR